MQAFGSAHLTGALNLHSGFLPQYMYASNSTTNFLNVITNKTEMIKTLLFENWKTSLLGIVLICAGLFTGLTARQSWMESGSIILAGVGLVFSRDAQKSPETIIKDA